MNKKMVSIVSSFIVLSSLSWCAKERVSSYPFISGDTFRAFADHIYDTNDSLNTRKVKKGDIIFVNGQLLEKFFNYRHPRIKQPYVLLTHNSDYSVPNYISSFNQPVKDGFALYLDDPKIIAWFGQNVDMYHPKLHAIPIGLANRYLSHGNIDVMKQVRKKLHTTKKRTDKLAYLNFNLKTDGTGERARVQKLFFRASFCFSAKRKSYEEYLFEMAQFKFVLSPEGNGIDCYRTWEALLVGCIPIVKHSCIDPLFKDLPVVLISDWEEITQEFLEQQYEKLLKERYNMDKLFADYWFEQIRKIQKKYKKG